MLRTPPRGLPLAVVLTALNYAALTGYDLLAFAYIGKPLPRGQIVLASFLAYAVSNNVGFAMLSGASVRYRFYTRWGVTAEELSRIVFSYSVTFWLGLLALGGLSLAPARCRHAATAGHQCSVAAGLVLMLVPPAYLMATLVRRAPLRIRTFELPLPPVRIASRRWWSRRSTGRWPARCSTCCCRRAPLSFLAVPGLLPGGDSAGHGQPRPGRRRRIRRPDGAAAEAVPLVRTAAAGARRLPGGVLPAAARGCAAGADGRRDMAAPQRTWRGRAQPSVSATEQLTPTVLAVFTFWPASCCCSRAPRPPRRAGSRCSMRSAAGRDRDVALPRQRAGVALLVLSQGLARRLDAAYYLTSIAMVAGMVASLLKGFDYEEAALLAAVLWCCGARGRRSTGAPPSSTRGSRPPGSRRSSARWARRCGWACSRSSTWSTRASCGGSSSCRRGVAVPARLGRRGGGAAAGGARAAHCHAPHEAPVPTRRSRRRGAGDRRAAATSPFLVYLRDKALLFNEANRVPDVRRAGPHVGGAGRSGGPEGDLSGLIRAFLERCDDFGGVPVFYEVGRRTCICTRTSG